MSPKTANTSVAASGSTNPVQDEAALLRDDVCVVKVPPSWWGWLTCQEHEAGMPIEVARYRQFLLHKEAQISAEIADNDEEIVRLTSYARKRGWSLPSA